MSAHTPGPWFIRAERYRFIHVWAHGGGIAHMDTVDGRGFADARLIAAAPKLLEALQELLEDYTGLMNSGDCGNWSPEEDPGVIKARAAIREATS